MAKFYHAGDLGDIIFSLPTIRALGGGRLVLSPHLGDLQADTKPSVAMTRARAAILHELLVRQPYISGVDVVEGHWEDRGGYNLNKFRNFVALHRHDPNPTVTNLAHLHLIAFQQSLSHADSSWLQVDFPWCPVDRPIVIGRSRKIHRTGFPWTGLLDRYAAQMLVLGTKEEWDSFQPWHARLQWIRTSDLFGAATILARASVYIGNESALFAVAEGLKVPVVLERVFQNRNMFNRETGLYNETDFDKIVKFIEAFV